MWRCLLLSSVLTLQLVLSGRADEIADAINRFDQLIKQTPDSAEAYVLRGRLHARARHHDKAIADFTRAMELDPTNSQAYDERGSERLISGQIDESIADFDKFLSAHPQLEPHHWKRGIAYYYADKFKDGTKQFDDHQTVNPNDVENAVWRYLCMARDQKLDKATASLLPIKGDTRVPMMELYELYAGRGTEKQVVAAIEAGDPSKEELNVRRFYAHLYLGLYYEAAGDKKLAKEHLTTAADKHEISHYMWDIARMHVDRLYKSKPADPGDKNATN